jgi:hypothetical protein
MPVILSPGDYDPWLNPEEQDSSKLAYMFGHFGAILDSGCDPNSPVELC